MGNIVVMEVAKMIHVVTTMTVMIMIIIVIGDVVIIRVVN